MKLLTFAKKPFMKFQAGDLRDRCHRSESRLKSLKSSVSASLLIIEACVKVLLIFVFHLYPLFLFAPSFSEIYFNTNVIATLFNDLPFGCKKCDCCIFRQLEDKDPS